MKKINVKKLYDDFADLGGTIRAIVCPEVQWNAMTQSLLT